MFPFDVILFDVGGVLLTNGWDHCERAEVLDRFGLDRAEFETRHAEHFPAWERDDTNAYTYLDQTVFYQPRGFSHEEFLDAVYELSVPLKDSALGILDELATSKKCMLGALNNEAREPNEYRFRKFGLREKFEVALSSCYLGLRKPEPAIYRRALDILGAPAGRVLFIDDRQTNADAAAAEGMQVIRYQGSEALRAELNRLGVL